MPAFTQFEPRPGVLALSGELCWQDASELKELLLGALSQHDKLELDLLNVTRLDTAGVQLLLMLHAEAQRSDKSLVWLGYSLAVEEVLELLGLADALGQPQLVIWS